MSFLERLRLAIELRKQSVTLSNESVSTATTGNRPAIDRRKASRTNARIGASILLVDDSPTVLSALSRMLRQNHFRVLEAADGETGLRLAQEHLPQLIFLDIVLPGINGFEVLRYLRRNSATSQIPVIIMSGNDQATEQFYAQRIGADDFMMKPFSRNDVFRHIEKLVVAHRLAPATQAERFVT